jgi:hypothetical protein
MPLENGNAAIKVPDNITGNLILISMGHFRFLYYGYI